MMVVTMSSAVEWVSSRPGHGLGHGLSEYHQSYIVVLSGLTYFPWRRGVRCPSIPDALQRSYPTAQGERLKSKHFPLQPAQGPTLPGPLKFCFMLPFYAQISGVAEGAAAPRPRQIHPLAIPEDGFVGRRI
jgi:hypothetical protein